MFSPYLYQPDDRALRWNLHGSKHVSPVTTTPVPSLSVLQGRAMAKAVGRRPLTSDARIRFLHPHLYLTTANKGKAIPLQAWTSPEGSRSFRFPDFKTIGT